MSSLSYNPNIDIPPYHDNMMQSYSNNGMMQPQMPQIIPMMQQPQMMQMMQQPQMMPMIQQQPQMMTPQMMSSQMLKPQMYQNQTKNKKQKKADQFTNLEEGTSSNWGVYIKKLIIFTILFLVISHVKTNDIIQKLPMVGSNEVFMMVVKGFIMAIIIIIVDRILG
jgi:hypothetical protein